MPDAVVRAPVSPGEIIAGKYRVERLIGVGGMAVVVAARHIQLDEPVAIKFLRDRVIDEPEMVARFQREARAVARLKGEHVVRVRDVSNLESGAPYIVMELLEGVTLKERLKQVGRMPTSQSVDYALQACTALAEAHANGIVHRDVKPTNLFLTTSADGRPLVKVFDFGISKVALDDPDSDLGMTSTTSMLGSPLYMSPEQMTSSRNVDARTDVWSLGVTLYRCLSGELPFHADSMPMVCTRVLNEAPRRVDTVNPLVPRPLADAVMRCLEKDPARRFQNVAELARAIEPFGSDVSRGASERVSTLLRGKVPPLTSERPVMMGSGTVITPPPREMEGTEVSFGESSGAAPLSARSERKKRSTSAVWLVVGTVLGLGGGLAIVIGRDRATPVAAVPSVAASDKDKDAASELPLPLLTAAPVVATPSAASSTSAPKAVPKPARVVAPAPAPRPTFDPGSYR